MKQNIFKSAARNTTLLHNPYKMICHRSQKNKVKYPFI